MMRKTLHRCLLLLLVVTLGPVAAWGHTPQELERVVDIEAVNFGDAALFVLAAAHADAPSGTQEAFARALEQGYLPRRAAHDEPITLGALSLLLMRSFDINGGLMYRLTGSPRYAFRELRGLNLTVGRPHPALRVSGEDLLQMIGNVSAHRGDEW